MLILSFLFGNWFDVQGRFLHIFKKIFIFKVPVIKKNEKFATLSYGEICRFLGIELNIPDRQQCAHFRTLPKSYIYHSTLPYTSKTVFYGNMYPFN